jgi:8-oxo-dGTP diphosphatase
MLQVVCAVITNKEKYLLCKRSKKMKMPLKWEFPGGKIKTTENAESALIREIKEELNVAIAKLQFLGSVIHHYPDFSIHLLAYKCQIGNQQIALSEHEICDWFSLSEIEKINLAEADKGIVNLLK